MDYGEIEQLRGRHPVWGLLRAGNVALVLRLPQPGVRRAERRRPVRVGGGQRTRRRALRSQPAPGRGSLPSSGPGVPGRVDRGAWVVAQVLPAQIGRAEIRHLPSGGKGAPCGWRSCVEGTSSEPSPGSTPSSSCCARWSSAPRRTRIAGPVATANAWWTCHGSRSPGTGPTGRRRLSERDPVPDQHGVPDQCRAGWSLLGRHPPHEGTRLPRNARAGLGAPPQPPPPGRRRRSIRSMPPPSTSGCFGTQHTDTGPTDPTGKRRPTHSWLITTATSRMTCRCSPTCTCWTCSSTRTASGEPCTSAVAPCRNPEAKQRPEGDPQSGSSGPRPVASSRLAMTSFIRR